MEMVNPRFGGTWAIFVAVCLWALGAVISPAALAKLGPETARVHFINVGAGDSILMEFSCGAILVDTGKDPAQMLNYLAEFFAGRPDLNNTLSLVILTHSHGDHVNGFVPLTKIYKVERLVFNGRMEARQFEVIDWIRQHPETKTYTVYSEDIPRGGLTNKTIDPLACNGTDPKIKVMWGSVQDMPKNWKRKAFRDKNNHSIVTRVDFGQASLLLTGDLEKRGIKSLLNLHGDAALDVDVFKIGHHGFSSGSTPELLKAVSPEVAVVSRPITRPLFGPDLELFEQTIQSARKPARIQVWERGNGLRVDEAQSLEEEDELIHGAEKNGVTRDATLERALYWTGLDGDVVIEMNASGKIDVTTSHSPLEQ